MSNTIGSIKFKNQYKNIVDVNGNYEITAPDGSKMLSFNTSAQLQNCTIKQYIDAVNTTVLQLQNTVSELQAVVLSLQNGGSGSLV